MASIPVRARAQPPRQPPTTAVTRRKRLGLAVGALSQLYAFVLERDLECLWEDTCVELGGGACEADGVTKCGAMRGRVSRVGRAGMMEVSLL